MDEGKTGEPKESKLVYVTPRVDGTYSAEVSPDIGIAGGEEQFMQIVNQWRDAMIEYAGRKGDDTLVEEFDSPSAAGGIKNFAHRDEMSSSVLQGIKLASMGEFHKDDRVLVKENGGVWYTAIIVSLPTSFYNEYEIQFDDGPDAIHKVSSDRIAKMPKDLPSSDNGYRLDESAGKFVAITTGGSSNAKKSRKSYRKKRRKSYKRK